MKRIEIRLNDKQLRILIWPLKAAQGLGCQLQTEVILSTSYKQNRCTLTRRYRSFKIETIQYVAGCIQPKERWGNPPGSRRCALDTETHRAFGSEKESFPDVTTRPGCRQWLFYTLHEWDYTLVDKSLAPFSDYVRGQNSAPCGSGQLTSSAWDAVTLKKN